MGFFISFLKESPKALKDPLPPSTGSIRNLFPAYSTKVVAFLMSLIFVYSSLLSKVYAYGFRIAV
jgi:hypothetical protein